VGASRGVYTWFLRRLAPEVHAVEPNPRLAARLARAFPDVAVHAVALSDREGRARLRIPRVGGAAAEGWATLEERRTLPGLGTVPVEESEVPVTTLDALALRDVGSRSTWRVTGKRCCAAALPRFDASARWC